MNVSAGDMAIQIKSRAGNDGRIVRVGRFLGEHPYYEGSRWHSGDGPCWLCEFQKPIKTDLGNWFSYAPCPDAWLRKVSGLPDEDATETERDKELTA